LVFSRATHVISGVHEIFVAGNVQSHGMK